jgi:hypothetical protein
MEPNASAESQSAGTAPAPRRSTFRPYRPADFERIRKLYQACFAIDMDAAVWAWKFDTVLTDPQPAFHVAESGDELVGTYPTRALRFQFGDQLRVVTQAQDVCVHPQHRGGTILRGIFRANINSESQAGVPFLFGFPNPEHLKVGVRIFNYIGIFPLSVWFRPLTRGIGLQNRAPWLRGAAYGLGARLQRRRTPDRPPPPGDRTSIVDLARFDAAVDGLWQRVRAQFHFAVVRDAAYLNWRYADRPGGLFHCLGAVRDGQLTGYCVYRDNLVRPDCWRVGAVMDLVAADPATAGQLTQAALTRMQAARCGFALAMAHPASAAAAALVATGFAPDPDARNIIATIRPYEAGLDIPLLQQPERWLLNYGDTDHMG